MDTRTPPAIPTSKPSRKKDSRGRTRSPPPITKKVERYMKAALTPGAVSPVESVQNIRDASVTRGMPNLQTVGTAEKGAREQSGALAKRSRSNPTRTPTQIFEILQQFMKFHEFSSKSRNFCRNFAKF